MMDLSIPCKVLNTLSFVNGILKQVPAGVKLPDSDYEKIVTYSIAWAIGGLYEAQERSQFHEWMQQKNCILPTNKKEN